MSRDSAPADGLNPTELGALRGWQRRMRLALGVSIALAVGYMALLVAVPDAPWLNIVAALVGAPLVVTGLLVLLSGRCPRCAGPVMPEPRLALPARCRRCGVAFGR